MQNVADECKMPADWTTQLVRVCDVDEVENNCMKVFVIDEDIFCTTTCQGGGQPESAFNKLAKKCPSPTPSCEIDDQEKDESKEPNTITSNCCTTDECSDCTTDSQYVPTTTTEPSTTAEPSYNYNQLPNKCDKKEEEEKKEEEKRDKCSKKISAKCDCKCNCNCKHDDPVEEAKSESTECVPIEQKPIEDPCPKTDPIRVMIVKRNGIYYATGIRCTHYNAPLDSGCLNGFRIRCALHGAAFNLVSGDIEDYPGCDNLATFPVVIRNNAVHIQVTDFRQLNTGRAPLTKYTMPAQPIDECICPRCEDTDVAIIGGGAAGFTVARTLRQKGYTGSITIFNKEDSYPYYRVKASKMPELEEKQLMLKMPQFYDDVKIKVLRNCEVTCVNAKDKCLKAIRGDENDVIECKVQYDKLFICVGAIPSAMHDPGLPHYADNCYMVRTLQDGLKVKNIEGDEVAVLGGNLLTMELASMIAETHNVTVICRNEMVMETTFGVKVGRFFKQLHEEKGVTLLTETEIVEFVMESDDSDSDTTGGDVITRLKLKTCNGKKSTIDIDALVVGIGAKPATDFLSCSASLPVELNDKGFIRVDGLMRTSHCDIFAAGDCVEFPLKMLPCNERVNVQHWGYSQTQGHVAAMNLIRQPESIVPSRDTAAAFNHVPFYWTSQYGQYVRFAGHFGKDGYDDVIVHGKTTGKCPRFVAYYVHKSNRVLACASFQYDPIVAQFAEYYHVGKTLERRHVQDHPTQWTGMISAASS